MSSRRSHPLSGLCAPLCAALVGLPVVSVAQPAMLQPVLVSGIREPQPAERVVADVVVIDEDRIRASSADSIEDLLRREGGIQLSRNGGPGQNAALLLRGGTPGQTVVLVDGVRVGSASLGQTDFAALSLAQVERIEVLRGPASSLYGADAAGGVVRIVTRRGSGAPVVAGYVAAGGLHSRAAEASVSGSNGGLDFAIGGARESSAGVSAVREGDAFGVANPDRDGFVRESVNLRTGLRLAPGHRIGLTLQRTRLDVQYDSAEYLPPTFAPDPSPDFRNRAGSRLVALDLRSALSDAWTASAQVAEQADDSLAGGVVRNRFDTRRRQLTAQLSFAPDADQQWVAALERLTERIDSDAYAAPERGNTALVLAWNARRGALRWQADFRHDRSSVHGGVGTGKIGAAYGIAPGWELRAVAGTAYRAPTFNDLYYPGYGVSTLRPERAASVELGVAWRRGDTLVDATAYRNRLRDLIGYEPDRSLCPPDPAYDFGCARNVRRARLQGLTLRAEQRLGEFAGRLVVDLLDATDQATGERLSRRAAHQETLAIDWARGVWSAGAALLSVGARPEGGDTLPAYRSVDLLARWAFAPRWRLEAQLRNAFDADIEPARDYRAPGRQAWIGLRFGGAGL